MRVIAGDYGGRHLKSLDGRSTRPTTDRVKEAMMSSVVSAHEGGFEDCRVLDAFAGSGALGIEALSRGASHCLFLECSSKALGIVHENLSTLWMSASRFQLQRGDACKLVENMDPSQTEPFDVVFLDPPYSLGPTLVPGILASLVRSGLLAPGAVVVYEHATGDLEAADGDEPFPNCPGLALGSQKTYGSTQVSILTFSSLR